MRILPLILALFLGTSCSSDEKKNSNKEKRPPAPPPTIAGSKLEEFTGARTKIVWTQYQNPDKVDKQGTSNHHHLMAIDTADGRGERKVLEQRANFAYPILTPDGERIVFTRKEKITKGDKRTFKPTTEIVNFDGSGLKKLGEGYAQEVWEDPETGKYWIYAGDEFVLAGGTAPICKRIIRYPLDDPSKREVVWDKTQMGTDSFAISADGKRFAGLFPWPAAGLGNLETNDWEKLTNGCWVAMAPDNSYDMWVFDGPHKNFLMFNAAGKQTATIQVNTHPDMKGKEVYHPRWGNHRQFFALSGPHTRQKKKGRGKPVEIFLGKFSPDLDSVESWFKITNNGMPDIYPDVWIDPMGSKPAVAKTNTKETGPALRSDRWPSDPKGLLLKWENIKAKNEFTAPDGSNQVTKLEPDGLARYGRNFEMVVDSGSFIPVLDSDGLVAKLKRGTSEFGFQALVTMNSDSGAIYGLHGSADLSLSLGAPGKIEYRDGTNEFTGPTTAIKKGTPAHLALSISDGVGTFYIDGVAIATETSSNEVGVTAQPSLVIAPSLDGTLEHIAFYDRPLTAEEVTTDYDLIRGKLDARAPVERLQTAGKLIARSPIPDVEIIKPYVRALVYYVYEVEGEKIAVGHWAILDSKPLGGLDREIGKTYDLVIEAKSAHPQLVSQSESMDEEQIDFLMPLYYDVSTPTPSE